MKKLGRRHRPFYRICVVDGRKPRDGKVLEEVGVYDPMVPETDARAQLKADRIDYWIGVGAQPSDKVKVLIKKYGTDGTHLAAKEAALSRLSERGIVPPAPEPVKLPKPVEEAAAAPEAPAAEAAAEAPAAEAAAPETEAAEASAEAAAEAPAAEAAPTEAEAAEAPAEASSEEKPAE